MKLRFGRLTLLLALLIGVFLMWMWHPFYPPAISVRFQVRPGESAREIAHDLHERRLLLSPWSFLAWVRLTNRRGAIKPGIYPLSNQEFGWAILQRFRRGPPLFKVTFPEGWTAKQMAELLERRGITRAAEFLAYTIKEKQEGYLFPDTYFFEEGIKAEAVVARMTMRFKQKAPRDFITQAASLHLSPLQLLTLASIVEKEAEAPDERPLIAGLYLKRLHQPMRLEADPTVQYALGVWKARLTYKDLAIESPYNTYRHLGLPPGPICNPGAAALEAAAHPATTDMMFFVADGHGRHRFSKTYKDHLALQNRIRDSQLDKRKTNILSPGLQNQSAK